ncbi:MAG: sensor histidine kinase [Ktedonobacterales bacterium]
MEHPSTISQNRRRVERIHESDLGALMDFSVYATVAAGYLMAVVQAGTLTLAGFIVLTAVNAAWLGVFRWMTSPTHVCRQWELVLLVACLVALAIAALGTLWLGNYFDWLLPVITVAVAATVFPPRSAVAQSSLVFVATLATFALRFGVASLTDIASLLPAFIFAFLFPLIVRQHQDQKERAEALVIELEEAQTQLQAYASQVEDLTVARERNRMAREIHDTLGHYLTILAVELETALKLHEHGDPRLGDELAAARHTAAECLTEVRRSVAALRPADPTAHSFGEALAHLAAEFEAVAPETTVALDAEGPLQELAPELRVALYRCVQESLTNVRKHGHAGKVLIRLRVDDSHVELTVLDNGVGATSSADGHAPGFGLLGMRERIALLGGAAVARAEPGRGWRVEVRVPLSCPIETTSAMPAALPSLVSVGAEAPAPVEEPV